MISIDLGFTKKIFVEKIKNIIKKGFSIIIYWLNNNNKKIPDPTKAKNHYALFLKNNSKKIYKL